MASQSLISAVNSYDNYIQRKGIDEQVIDAYIEACRVAINGEKDITYGLHITNRSKGIVERFCMERTGGTIWDLEKYSFTNKTHYSLTDKLYDVLLLEAQNKVVDSAYRYLEKKREPRERFYMPRRKQFLKIGLMDAIQGMIDDIYDILCVSLIPGAGKTTVEKMLNALVAGWFPRDFNLFTLTVEILHVCTMTVCTIFAQILKSTLGMKFSQIFLLPVLTQKWSSLTSANINHFHPFSAHP